MVPEGIIDHLLRLLRLSWEDYGWGGIFRGEPSFLNAKINL
jgi:hypothetical protein